MNGDEFATADNLIAHDGRRFALRRDTAPAMMPGPCVLFRTVLAVLRSQVPMMWGCTQ